MAELHFTDELGLEGWAGPEADEEAGREARPRGTWTVPVFLWHLDSDEMVLLDRKDQAVSFPDMVIAVQTRAGPGTADFACNGEHVPIRPDDPSRAAVAAVLQTAWAVAPTHVHFSGKSNKSETSYVWSAAPTPFGPFYSGPAGRVGFALADAARRNLVYAALQASLAPARESLAGFALLGKRLDDVLHPEEAAHWTRRWNLMKFKMQRVATYLSLLNFDTALYYAASLRHDAHALQSAIKGAAHVGVHSYIGCVHDERPSVLSFLVYCFGGLSLVIMTYLAAHGFLSSRRKHDFSKKL